MSEFEFVDAAPEAEKVRLALTGPSGSGKTWTALRIAQGIGGSIGLIDTEKRSARKYGRTFKFKTLDLSHYDPRTLIKAVAKATEQGLEVLIIDSFSHFWSGKGGILAQVDEAGRAKRGGNSFGGWADVRPLEADMLDALLSFPGHLIVCMRVKTEWQIEDRDGKKVPVKLGLKPDQRDGVDYEFDLVGDLDLDHNLTVSKSRVPEIPVGSSHREPGEDFGKTLSDWLSEGVATLTVNDYRDRALDPNATYEGMLALYSELEAAGKLGAVVNDDTGETVQLGSLIRRVGQSRKAQAGKLPKADTGSAGQERKQATARLTQLWAEAEITDPANQIAYATETVGRDVTSLDELTAAEGKRLVERLARFVASQAGPAETEPKPEAPATEPETPGADTTNTADAADQPAFAAPTAQELAEAAMDTEDPDTIGTLQNLAEKNGRLEDDITVGGKSGTLSTLLKRRLQIAKARATQRENERQKNEAAA